MSPKLDMVRKYLNDPDIYINKNNDLLLDLCINLTRAVRQDNEEQIWMFVFGRLDF